MQNRLKWSDLKAFLDERKVPAQFVEFDNHYLIRAIDGPNSFWCELGKVTPAPEESEQEDFELNYKPYGNKTYSDTDGTVLYRLKISQKGWQYFEDYFELETSKLDSLVHKDMDNQDCSYVTVKFYDDSDQELTDQNDLDSSCVKTVIDWMPPYDYEIIGGAIRMKTQPSADLYTWVVAVPDISAQYGGSKEFLRNLNLSYLTNSLFKNDGRVPKYLKYDAVNKTNKFRIIFRHPTGLKQKVMLNFELFKE